MQRNRFVSLVFLIVLLVAQLPPFLFDFTPQAYATTATFGYTGTGGAGTTSIENTAVGSEFTIAEDGTAISITAYLTPASLYMANCKAAIYFANNTLLGIGTAATVVSEVADWYTFTYASGPALTAGTAYVLVVDGTSGTGTCVLSYATNDTVDQGHTDSQTYSGFPEATLVPTHSGRKYSIYCTYTVAVTGPAVSDVAWTTNTYVNEAVNISVKWTGTTLDWCGFTWNASGSWTANETIFNDDGGSIEWGNITKTLPATNGTVISFREYGNDTNGMGSTGIYNFTVTYGSWTKLEVASCDLNTTYPVTWTQIANDINFTGALPAWREYSTDVTIMWGRWIKFTNITTGDANHYLRAYEIQIYDANSSSYKTPTAVYSKCGETSTYVATNFIDGSSSTYWKHDVNELHEIVVDMGAYIKISKFNYYDALINNAGQLTYVDVYTANPWAVVGVNPWINGTDYATNYVTTVTAEAVLGNFSFQQLSSTYRYRVTEIRLELNFTKNIAASQITAQWWNTTTWVNASFSTSATTWTCMNVTLPIYFNEMRTEIGKVNGMKVRFVGNESSTFTIDYACLYVQGCLNLDNSEHLWACSYSGAESNWSTTGDSPYLDNNTDSHGHLINVGDNASWFLFDYYALATFQQVWLNIEANSLTINITVDNGVANYTYQLDLCFPVAWYSVNVSNAFSTTTKLNSARMKVTAASDSEIVPMATFYRCYLRVYRIYSIADCNATVTGQPTTLSCHFTSTNGLSTYALNHNMSGSWLGTNITGTLSGNDDWGNYTLDITMSSANVFSFVYYANDSLGTWDFSEYVYKPIMWNGYTSEDMNLLYDDLESDLGTFQHGLGRNCYYVPFIEGATYWVMFANQTIPPTEYSEFVYYASYDGKNWSASGTIRELQNETYSFTGGMMYGYYEQRGGVNYFHYQYCAEFLNASFWYRRGIFNYNLTITWSTPTEQLVFNGSLYRVTEGEQKDRTFAINGIVTSPNGHVWMYYWRYATDSMDITHCELTNGTWATAAGYPQTLFGAPYNASGWAFEGYVFSTPDEENCYVVAIRGFTPSKVYGRALINGVPQTIENASDLTVFELRRFSSFAVDGNVHVVYLASNASLRYCFRNYTTSTWTIQDEFISDTVSDTRGLGRGEEGQGDPAEDCSVTYPVIGFNIADGTVYCNWADLDYESFWFDVRNSSGWIGKERLVIAPTGTYFLKDPNINPEWVNNNCIFVMEVVNATSGESGKKAVWVYKYELDVTLLLTGWTNFTAWNTDVGKTLEQICANIQFNAIDSTIIINYNGTEYRYDYGLEPNSSVLVLVETDELRIYCIIGGNWYHDYNNFYYRKNSTSQNISVSLSAPRQIEVVKTASQALTPSLGVERLAEMIRSASQTIASALSMGRLVEWLKSVSQTISVSLTGSNLIVWIQAVTLLVGIGIATSRSTELFKNVTQSLNLASSVERLSEFWKTTSQTISTSLTANRLIDVTKLANQNIGFAFGSSRLAEFVRAASQAVNVDFAVAGLADFFRTVSQTITSALNAQRLIEVTRLASQALTFSLQTIGERVGIYLRNVALTIATSLQGSRLAEWIKSVSQTFTVGFAVASLADFARSASQTIATVINGERMVDILRSASQTITFTLQTIGEKVGIYLRDAALTITTAFQGSRLAEWIKATSQTISVTLGNTRLAGFVRTASQAIALAFGSVGEKLGNYFANVALSITATLQTSRQAEWIRQATQTLTLSLSTSRVAEFLAIVVLTITTAFNATRLVDLLRQASQSLNFLLNGERLIEVSRSVSQTIALTFETLGEMVGNYFRNAVLNIGFTFTVLSEVPAATILLALAIALIVVACVVTYAVAKTQTTEKD